MATELKSRSFRVEDEVWFAIQAHGLSANQLLRRALGMKWKESKKAKVIRELAESDLTAQAVGRDDIQYGTAEEIPEASHVVNAGPQRLVIKGGKRIG